MKTRTKSLWLVLISLAGIGFGLILAKKTSNQNPHLRIDPMVQMQRSRDMAQWGEEEAQKKIRKQLQQNKNLKDLVNTIHFGWKGQDFFSFLFLQANSKNELPSFPTLRCLVTGISGDFQQEIEFWFPETLELSSFHPLGWRTYSK